MIKFSKRKSSKILSVLLAMTMMFAFLPTTVFAAENNSVSKLANNNLATPDSSVQAALKATLASTTVATVGDAEYATLAEAVQEALTLNVATTIVVTANIDLGDTGVTINSSNSNIITLNLNGYTITHAGGEQKSAIRLEGSASLTVTDDTSGKNGKLSETGEAATAIKSFSSGTITVTGGIIEATAINGKAIDNLKMDGTAVVTGGTVRATGQYGNAIFNSQIGEVKISGGTVEATDNSGVAIYNLTTGKITISDGTVTSNNSLATSGTIALNQVPTSNDKIVLSIQGGTVSNTATPNEGFSVYFKDASVTSENLTSYYTEAVGANVGKIRPGYAAEITNSSGTKTKYASLKEAFNKAVNSDTIKVLSDVDLGTTGVSYQSKALTLDLNGKRITYSGTVDSAIKLNNNASLTVSDTSAVSEQKGKLEATGEPGTAIFNSSTGGVNVTGGTIEAAGKDGTAIVNNDTGKVNVTGGTIEAAGKDGFAIFNNSTSEVKVTGGTIKATGEGGIAIYNNNTGKITISGATTLVTSKNTSTDFPGTIYLGQIPSTTSPDKIVLDIQSGTVSNTATPNEGYSVYFQPTSVTIENLKDYYKEATVAKVGNIYPEFAAEITKSDGIKTRYASLAEAITKSNSGDTVKVTSDIDLKSVGAIVSGDKAITLDLNGKKITYNGTNYAIRLDGTSSITVTDTTTEQKGKVEATGDNSSAIGNMGTGEVKVTGGTLQAEGANQWAIYNASTGKITISGEKTLITSKNTNNEQGTIYLNQVPSPASTVLDIQSGKVTNTATPKEGYSVYFKDVTIENLKNYYSQADGTTVGMVYPFVPVAEITNSNGTTQYPTLAKAISAASNNDTIKVTSDVDLKTTGIKIDGSKAITLDLNGKTVTNSGSDNIPIFSLKDSVSLTVTDTTNDKKGKLLATNQYGIAISNQGTGTVTVSGGTVEAAGANGIAISSNNTGKITISGEKTLITSKNANDAQGTIYLNQVPSTGDKIVLDIQGSTVSNTASPKEGYSVYFEHKSVTADNVTDYFSQAEGSTVGKVYPSKSVDEITYTVTFSSSNADIPSQTVKKGDKVVKPADPISSTGQTFDGWIQIVNNKSITWNFDVDTVTNDITLYATWIPKDEITYTVTFSSSNADIPSQTVKKGGKIVKPADPISAGQTFAYWYQIVNGARIKWNFDVDTVTSDITLYASWKPNPKPTPPSTGGSYSGGGTSTYTNHTPEIISGAKQSIVEKNNEQATFRIDRPFVNFLYVEAGKTVLVEGTHYTVKDGSTIVTLLPAYTNTLSVGTHTVRVEFIDGYAVLEFEIKAKAGTPTAPTAPVVTPPVSNNPQTGDSWFAGLFNGLF